MSAEVCKKRWIARRGVYIKVSMKPIVEQRGKLAGRLLSSRLLLIRGCESSSVEALEQMILLSRMFLHCTLRKGVRKLVRLVVARSLVTDCERKRLRVQCPAQPTGMILVIMQGMALELLQL